MLEPVEGSMDDLTTFSGSVDATALVDSIAGELGPLVEPEYGHSTSSHRSNHRPAVLPGTIVAAVEDKVAVVDPGHHKIRSGRTR